jgi:hypothetical protein
VNNTVYGEPLTEAWDMDRVITEFGWIGGEPVEDMGHRIVAKHRGYTNHFVPEHRRVCRSVVPSVSSRLANVGCQLYDIGRSEDMTMKQLKERVHNTIQSMATPGPLFFVFHDNSQNIKYLLSGEIDAPLDGLSSVLPESCTEAETSDTPKIYIVDTSELFAALAPSVTRAGRNAHSSAYAPRCRSNLRSRSTCIAPVMMP